MSQRKSFLLGKASGMVDPVAGVFVLMMHPTLPYALCFAAEVMIFVVAEELISASQRIQETIAIVTMAIMDGFSVVMILSLPLSMRVTFLCFDVFSSHLSSKPVALTFSSSVSD